MSDIKETRDNTPDCDNQENDETEIIFSEDAQNTEIGKELIPAFHDTMPKLPRFNLAPMLASCQQLASNLSLITANITSAMNAIQPTLTAIHATVTKMVAAYAETIQNINSPIISILESFDTSYLSQSLQKIAQAISAHYDSDRIKKVLLTVMAESKWFPYAGWIDDLDTLYEISDIVASSRGASDRRTKRIDKVVLNYYTNGKIREIKSNWWHTDLPFCIRKILGQALEAHLRGEYALSITCLATMWEGLILDKIHVLGRQKMKKTKKDFADLIDENNFAPIFSEFYNDYIVSDCNSAEEVIEGIPNRNGISHSKYKKYPNKKASLNAILLTDFIINLQPKQQMEEENG